MQRLFCLCYHCIKQYKKAKKTKHYTILGIFYQLTYQDKIKNLEDYIFEKFYTPLKILGWISGFRAIDNLPCAHQDETEFT